MTTRMGKERSLLHDRALKGVVRLLREQWGNEDYTASTAFTTLANSAM